MMPGPQQPVASQQTSQPSSTSSSASGVVSSTNSNASTGATTALSSTSGESQQQMNTLSLCKVGAETVQDIVSKTLELLSILKALQLPNGTQSGTQASTDSKNRIQDNINRTRHLFKRLQIIYTKVNEDCGGVDYTPIESLIPYVDDVESNKPDMKKKSEAYKQYSEEVSELREQVFLRSRYLKDIIDQLRKIIWEINTMMAVRATS